MEYAQDFEEYEDESSDDGGDQMDRILVPKLPVADFDDYDPTEPPLSGEEYLRRVQLVFRLEAQKCPEVVVADMDLNKFKSNQTVVIENSNGFIKADPEWMPSVEWQREQVSEFTKVRLKMCRMKDFRIKCGLTDLRPFFRNKPMSWWQQFCTGRKADDTSDSSSGSDTESDLNKSPSQEKPVRRQKTPKPEPNQPLLSYLCDMTTDEVIRVLSYHHQWVQQLGFTEHNGRWIYALLVALEKPLPSEVYSILRDLSRVCSQYRLKIKSKSDSKTLIALNLIICLIGRYFDQNDMCDH